MKFNHGQIMPWSEAALVVFSTCTYMRRIPVAKCIHQNIPYSLKDMHNLMRYMLDLEVPINPGTPYRGFS